MAHCKRGGGEDENGRGQAWEGFRHDRHRGDGQQNDDAAYADGGRDRGGGAAHHDVCFAIADTPAQFSGYDSG